MQGAVQWACDDELFRDAPNDENSLRCLCSKSLYLPRDVDCTRKLVCMSDIMLCQVWFLWINRDIHEVCVHMSGVETGGAYYLLVPTLSTRDVQHMIFIKRRFASLLLYALRPIPEPRLWRRTTIIFQKLLAGPDSKFEAEISRTSWYSQYEQQWCVNFVS